MSGRQKDTPPLLEWRKQLLESELGWAARYVGLALSVHMNGDGQSCFPSLTTIQRETALGRSTVCGALSELEQARFISRARGGPTRPTRYTATSAPHGLPLVRHTDGGSAPHAPEDVQEGVQKISGRAGARRKKEGARASGTRPSDNIDPDLLAYDR